MSCSHPTELDLSAWTSSIISRCFLIVERRAEFYFGQGGKFPSPMCD